MKLFKCDHCGHPVYFENYFCVYCNASLGFDHAQMDLLALHQVKLNGALTYTRDRNENVKQSQQYKYCSNKQYNVCNWILPQNSTAVFCVACNLNRTIPNLSQPDHLARWQRIEVAKHRLVYSLLRLKLPVVSKFQEKLNGIAFDFKADENKRNGERLLTGHEQGLITLNIEEADDVIREMARNQMDEVYRTVLGHFRHEIGHYYWDRLINNTDKLMPFRQLFGDERMNYAEALKKHYTKAPSNAWKGSFISTYATSHPWEDWAETWAHYLHIVDTLETAYAFEMTIQPPVAKPEDEMSAKLNIDPYMAEDFTDIIDRWIPLTFVMNSLNRSMGLKDLYPFYISDSVVKKLNFIHRTIKESKLQIAG